MDKTALEALNANSNPFNVMEKFAQDFLINCRGFVIKHMILKNTEHMRDMRWRYLGNGDVMYSFMDTVHHPAGYHYVGSAGAVDFGAFSAWDEEVRATSVWNIVTNKHAIHTDLKELKDPDHKNMVEFIDTIFSDHPVSYEWIATEVMPKFNKIKKFW